MLKRGRFGRGLYIRTVEEWGKREIEGLEIIGLRKGEERVKGGEKRVKEGRLGAES